MEPIASASAIVGMMNVIANQAPKGLSFVSKNIREAYTEVQAEQTKLAAAQNYIRRYDQRHCQVKVMPGLMKEPLPLEEIYTAVKLLDDRSIRYFTGLDDLEETYRAKGLRRFGGSEGEPQDGMVVANAEQYLMVLGGPGIGKSTFLRKIGLEALKPKTDETKQIHRDCIPVLIELKEFRGDAIDLKQKIAHEFDTCGFPEAMAFTEASLEQGKLLVLLDGLDEVPTRNLNTVIQHIEDFVDAHDQNTFVASCRIAAYRGSQGTFFNRFTDVTLAEFDDEQIEQFIRRWFRSQLDQEAGTADRYWELLQKDEHKATKELAQTPLLLTFLCLLYDREQTLPAQRSTLYGKALNILLSEWAAQKRLEQDPIYEGFHPDLEKVLLAEIAYESFKNDQLFFLKDDLTRRISEFLTDTLDAPKHLDGAAVLQAIEKQQGILVERAADIYSFSHLTLQEYLTAFHITEERLEDELIQQHSTNERWREVFLLVSGLSGNRAIDLLRSIHTKFQEQIKNYAKILSLFEWSKNITEGSRGSYQPLAKRLAAIRLAVASEGTDADIFVDLTEDKEPILSRITYRRNNISKSITDFSYSVPEIYISANFDSPAMDIAVARKNEAEITFSPNFLDAKEKDGLQLEEIDISNLKIKAINVIRDTPSFGESRSVKVVTLIDEIFNDRNLEKLGDLANLLNKPPESDDSNVLFRWADELETLWFKVLSLSKADVTFTAEEAKAFQDYIYAINLLIRCKAAAIRVSKQAWVDLEANLLTA